MKKLIHEVHRRSLWQVLGIYLAGSWIVLQVVGQMADSLALPAWVEPFAVVLLLIGLPIVLATAFIQESGPRRDGLPAPDPASPAEPESAPVAPANLPVSHNLLTWRNAIVGGILAFLLLGTAVGAFMMLRSAGIGTAGTLVAKGLLDERAPVVVADFASPDSMLGRAATEAFRIDISQSQVVQVLEPAELAGGLERMERSTRDGLGADVALELAVREGIPAVIAGEITPVGKGFVLSARVLEPSDGSTLASVRETADDTASVLAAIDALSKRVRERVGESYASLRADPALEKVTTASLEALQLYTEALDAYMVQGDDERGLTLLEEAVALDPEFAMAWRKMGVELTNNFGSQARIDEALTRAYEHRERLPERERLLAMAAYYNSVTGEQEKAIAAYERMLDRDPNDAWATNNVAILYGELRDHEREEEYMERSFAIDSSASTSFTNLASVKYGLGKRAEAWDLLQRAQRQFPDNPGVDLFVAMVLGSERDFAAADSMLRNVAAGNSSNLVVQRSTLGRRAALAFAQGKIADSQRLRAQATDIAVEIGQTERVHLYALWNATGQLLTVYDTAAAMAAVDAGLERVPLDDLPFADRRYFWLATLYSFTGDPARARSYLDAYEAGATEDQRRADEDGLLMVRGHLAYADGDPAAAAALYAEADRGSCTICTLNARALAWDAAAHPDSALFYWKAYLDDTQINRMFWDQNQLGAAIERAAQLADELGDTEQAALYYDQLVELWVDADQQLQPRVLAAQARLEEIVRERG